MESRKPDLEWSDLTKADYDQQFFHAKGHQDLLFVRRIIDPDCRFFPLADLARGKYWRESCEEPGGPKVRGRQLVERTAAATYHHASMVPVIFAEVAKTPSSYS
jgi:hypothetical protein